MKFYASQLGDWIQATNSMSYLCFLSFPAWEQQMQSGSKKKDEIQEKFEKKLKALGVCIQR